MPPQDPEAGKKAEYVDHFFQIDSKLNNNKPFNKTITHQHKKNRFQAKRSQGFRNDMGRES